MDIDMYAQHSSYSDPGEYAPMLRKVDPNPASLHEAATRSIVHYREEKHAVTPRQQADVDLRWMRDILKTLTQRDDSGLASERNPDSRVGGCCRDHSLLSVAVLREHQIPARIRIGFADYFRPGFHHDHVVVEQWKQRRWVRFDPELSDADFDVAVHDLPRGDGAPFETAAEAWLRYRAGEIDLANYGVDPNLPTMRGPAFVQRYVLKDLAALMREELLLWDIWEGMTMPGEPVTDEIAALTDRVASLIVTWDGGDDAAAWELEELWKRREIARPGPSVLTFSPTGKNGTTDIVHRSTSWN